MYSQANNDSQFQANNDSELLRVIDRINDLLSIFEEQQKNQKRFQVTMLVGATGNGKSTIFNFLSSFELQTQKEGKQSKLILKNPEEAGTSPMKAGIKSITKEPYYYFKKENNHLLIDFPGFQDTEGVMQQRIIQILFNRIVIKTQIKIIYVIKQSDDDLYGRGGELWNFINNCFAQNSTKEFQKIILLLNCYMEQLEDNELIASIQNQLKSKVKQPNKRIIVIRKVKSDEDVQEYLSQKKMEEIWSIIEKSDSIKFKTAQFQKNGEIANFINLRCNQFTNQIISEICMALDEKIKYINILKLKTLLEYFIEIKLLINIGGNQAINNWYNKLIEINIKIAKLLKLNLNFQDQINVFLKIFRFFSQEEDIIDTRAILKDSINQVKNLLVTHEQILKQKLDDIQKKAQDNNLQQLLQLFKEMNEKMNNEIKEQNELMKKLLGQKEQELQQVRAQLAWEREQNAQKKKEESNCFIC
ncbi:unnamed protein product [Paramecium sonneborni]|uniref:G domain-containing protein n=1 Tax=Paramecium sonneborni TaxID=65129 RepID=A0A8S1PI78_9CILI|nr:unnamed protein product [Paramecium sonneborni]